jgi:hypothetical protein
MTVTTLVQIATVIAALLWLTVVLVDWIRRRVAQIDVTPTEPLWSPFAQDGKLRDDLLAVRRVNGVWLPNPKPNYGFYHVGSLTIGKDER